MKTMSESAPDGAWHTASAQSEVAEILKGRWDSPKHQAQGRRKETRSILTGRPEMSVLTVQMRKNGAQGGEVTGTRSHSE